MIGIAIDTRTKWYVRFKEALEEKQIDPFLFSMEDDNWLNHIEKCDQIIWRPNLAEPLLTQAREKIYFISQIMGKKIYPSLSSFWHYDKKRCQHYIFQTDKIKTPATHVFYSYNQAVEFLKRCEYPIVSKGSGGAASRNVRLLQDFSKAKSELDLIFRRTRLSRLGSSLLGKMGLAWDIYSGQTGYVYYQQMLKGNEKDYRVTTIGDKIAFSFERRNRKNDFRASGSGLIDYEIDHNTTVIQYCLDLSRRYEFDTMCYDILFENDDFYIVEFSYTFNDTAIHNCPGYFKKTVDELEWVQGHVWPQKLIVESLLAKWGIA